MDGAELKQEWLSGQPSFGAWISLTDPAVTAVMCNAGYKWLMIDAEHLPYNAETLRSLIATMRSRDVVPLVRVRANDEAIIKQVLDMGAEGIAVPMIRTADDARRAVMACHYPPFGIRGCGPRDASNFYQNIDHYRSTIENRVVVILWIEHIDAVNNLDEILRVPGVDALVLGPTDLSYSMGLPWQITHPKVEQAIDTIITKARVVHIPVGHSATTENFESWRARGINPIFLGSDYEFMLRDANRFLNQARRAVGLGQITVTTSVVEATVSERS